MGTSLGQDSGRSSAKLKQTEQKHRRRQEEAAQVYSGTQIQQRRQLTSGEDWIGSAQGHQEQAQTQTHINQLG